MRHLYNNLLKYVYDARYLELGTYNGSSTFSAMYNNTAKILSIENWSVIQGKQDFITNFNNYKGQNDATYIDTDYINNVPQITSKYNIYSYNYLDDIFIYIKNDWDQEYVRQETSDAITYLNLKYIYKKEIIISNTFKKFGNSICIFILKK